MNRTSVALLFGCIVAVLPVFAEDSGVTGEDDRATGALQRVTATAQGLFLVLDGGTPANCTTSPQGWLAIPDDNRAMLSLALYAHARKTPVTVRTDGINPRGYCIVTQLDLGR